MIIAGYIFSILMGVVLGTLGAGGSILILPILVYFMDINPSLATAYSLIIVAFTALVGSIKYITNKQMNLVVLFIFAVPSVITIYITRRYLLPAFPESLYLGQIIITKDFLIMLIFSLLMLSASYLMLFSKEIKSSTSSNKLYANSKIILNGSIVGFFTGIIGAGGGFLIVPALVIFSGLNMKTAVGTSLFIIFIKSMIGFLGDVQAGVQINYYLIIMITICTSIGILIGVKYSKNISGNALKKTFGYFLILISLFIIIKEIMINFTI